MVAFVTKKFYLDEMKIVCDKFFFVQELSKGPKTTEKAPFSAIFHHFTLLLNHLEDNLAIILSQIWGLYHN